ncbi:hypothetical protein PHMEG_00015839 [Phytophthora megakarya]|uniref:Uncharacterized protein n=1 Tax=Phytophthora megakarya TaxID=4795 RepID=A0A225W1D2_9STRA|nr:hypothetical protein PHMEG_00015839 [Phytophthora megakarya]
MKSVERPFIPDVRFDFDTYPLGVEALVMLCYRISYPGKLSRNRLSLFIDVTMSCCIRGICVHLNGK